MGADITLTEAEVRALQVRPGTINNRGQDDQVGIDAKTGKVLENWLEGKARTDA